MKKVIYIIIPILIVLCLIGFMIDFGKNDVEDF